MVQAFGGLFGENLKQLILRAARGLWGHLRSYAASLHFTTCVSVWATDRFPGHGQHYEAAIPLPEVLTIVMLVSHDWEGEPDPCGQRKLFLPRR